MWLAQQQGKAGLRRRRRQRLSGMVRHARTSSPYYRRHYRGLPGGGRLTDLPPVAKPELMDNFDEWVTDPSVTRAAVEDFIADPARAGAPFVDDIFVCTSSGSTGRPGLFVHDAAATDVYWANPLVRGYAFWLSLHALTDLLRRRAREAQVIGTNGHFGGVAWAQRARLRSAMSARTIHVFSVGWQLAELDAALEAFDPSVLAGYPTALDLLATEQAAGRLHLRLLLAAVSGESVAEGALQRMEADFGCIVRQSYACSEALFVAHSCTEGWLHVSSDWYILEPVQRDGTPTPAGQFSDTVLLTNLANRLQPIIRYDLGDSVCLRPDACPCGSPLPAIKVAGRRADVLTMLDAAGQPRTVVPLVLGTAVDPVPGATMTQLVQTGPSALAVRFETEPGVDPATVWALMHQRLAESLTDLGLANVTLDRDPAKPVRDAASGKFRRIVSATHQPREADHE